MSFMDLYTLAVYALIGALALMIVWEYIRLRSLTRHLRQKNDRDLNA